MTSWTRERWEHEREGADGARVFAMRGMLSRQIAHVHTTDAEGKWNLELVLQAPRMARTLKALLELYAADAGKYEALRDAAEILETVGVPEEPKP